MRIFLSYASEDKETADKIFLSLVKRHKVFFDHTGLKGGDDFDDKIREEVKKCELFIFLISPHSIVKSSYALTELMFAREKWSHPEGHVLPVMISETNYDSIPAYLKAVTILEPEGSLAAEVRARVEGWQQNNFKSRVGIVKYIGIGIGAIVVLAAIIFASTKIFNSNGQAKISPSPITTQTNNPSPVTNSITPEPTVAAKTSETPQNKNLVYAQPTPTPTVFLQAIEKRTPKPGATLQTKPAPKRTPTPDYRCTLNGNC
jgi:hypothetical protein